MFDEGDTVVTTNTDAPIMTICRIMGKEHHCFWFEGSGRKDQYFYADELRKPADEEESDD